LITKLEYRPDIDGLRALAVLAVVASHLPEKFLPSGFLGVDIFFVISGFVVTASLLGQRRTGLTQLYVNFLSRRVKRLIPALTVCVAVTGLVVLATDPFPRHSIQTGLAALFGFANIVLFNFELDYFSPSSIFNAFTHTWSLGVEEQFYVVFPLFSWFFYFRLKSGSFKPLSVAMILGGLVSVLLFAWLYEDHQPAAFFLMPTRIWELGVGALVFLASQQGLKERLGGIVRYLSPFALVGLMVSFFAEEGNAVPATLAAVGFTGLLLACDNRTLAKRVLELPPFVYIGRISYSLYLWHWPVIALGPIVLATEWRSSLLYVIVMGAAAVLSFHWIEKPLRYRAWTGSSMGNIGLGLACNAVLGAVLLFTMVRADASGESATTALHPPAYLPVIPHNRKYESTCIVGGGRPLKADTVMNCTVAPKPDSEMPTIWGLGDSHAGHLQGLLYELHEKIGVGVHLIETPGWAFPFQGDGEFEPRLQIIDQISSEFRPGDIALVSRIYLSRTHPHPQHDLEPWLQRVSVLADELAEQGMSTVVTGPPPIFHYKDIRECSLDDRETCRLERAEIAAHMDAVMERLNELATHNDNIVIFNIFESTCPSDTKYCYPDNGSSYLYKDRDHFNSLGAKLLAEPFVDLLRSSGALAPER
jgi:peptidoglycan/LPS O-acetylase OafA/YrhL